MSFCPAAHFSAIGGSVCLFSYPQDSHVGQRWQIFRNLSKQIKTKQFCFFMERFAYSYMLPIKLRFQTRLEGEGGGRIYGVFTK